MPVLRFDGLIDEVKIWNYVLNEDEVVDVYNGLTVPDSNNAPEADNFSVSTDEDNAVATTLLATDIDEDDLTYSVVTGPSNGILSGTAPNLTYTPNQDYHGSDSLTYRANDGALDSNLATVSLTIDPVNDSPVISSSAPVVATEDVAYSYQVEVDDPDDANDGTQLSFSLTDAPLGMSISSTGLIGWTPLEGVTSSGAVTVEVTDGGEDGAVAGSEIFTVAVTAVNDAPTISGSPAATVNQGEEYLFIPTAEDIDDGDTLNFSIDNPPLWAEFDASTGRLRGTPTDADVGTYPDIVITVTDSSQASASLPAFNLTVLDPGQLDMDGDGHIQAVDCNDADPDIYPGAEEICSDGIDQDCNGADLICPEDIDDDLDGFSENQGDCDDDDPDVYPGALDLKGDGIDQDCDGNDPPMANAGNDQFIVSLEQINLSGSGADYDENHLEFNWSIIDEPYQGAGRLQDAITPTPILFIDEYGTYEIQLEVCDEFVCDFDTVLVSIDNLPPIADAGDDQSIDQYQLVCLIGNGSDPNGDDISYSWQVTSPTGTDITPIENTSAQLCFMAEQDGIHTTILITNDGVLDSEPDTAHINVKENTSPVAVINGAGQTHEVGVQVCFGGSDSYDPDGDAISFSWSVLSGQTTLDNPQSAGICFTPDFEGDYLIQLIVSDEYGKLSEPETTVITAEEPSQEIPGDLDGDNDVDAADRSIIFAAMRACEGDANYHSGADMDGDGCVTFVDYVEWYKSYKEFLNN